MSPELQLILHIITGVCSIILSIASYNWGYGSGYNDGRDEVITDWENRA